MVRTLAGFAPRFRCPSPARRRPAERGSAVPPLTELVDWRRIVPQRAGHARLAGERSKGRRYVRGMRAWRASGRAGHRAKGRRYVRCLSTNTASSSGAPAQWCHVSAASTRCQGETSPPCTPTPIGRHIPPRLCAVSALRMRDESRGGDQLVGGAGIGGMAHRLHDAADRTCGRRRAGTSAGDWLEAGREVTQGGRLAHDPVAD